MSKRVMYDTDTPEQMPTSGWDLLAGYRNGSYLSYDALKKRFPNAVVVGIDVMNQPGIAQVLDRETGDATIEDCPGWYDASIARGIFRPTIYFSLTDYDAIATVMGNRKWDAWIADWSGRDRPLFHNEVATQIQNHGPNGENIDISIVHDDTWNPTGEPDMTPQEHQWLQGTWNTFNELNKMAQSAGYPDYSAFSLDLMQRLKRLTPDNPPSK